MINAVCALIVDKDNNILSVSRKDNHNDWGLPGGKLDEGETFNKALLRETLEETGYIIEPLNQLNYFEAKENNMLVRTYLAQIIAKSTKKLDSSETGLVDFKTKEDLLNGSFKEYNKDCFLHFNL